MVQGSLGPRHVIYKLHGPQTPQTPYQVFFGLHAVDNVDILQLMKTLYADADKISQFINLMEAAQRKSKRAKI